MSFCYLPSKQVNQSSYPKFLWELLAANEPLKDLSQLAAVFHSSEAPRVDTVRCIASLVVLLAVGTVLYKWFYRYRLRYLLRCSSVIICVVFFLNTFCPFRSDGSTATVCSSHCFTTFAQVSAVLFLTMVIVRYHWSEPINITKSLLNIGFSHLTPSAKKRKKGLGQLARERLDEGDPGEVPPVYPNGWIPIVESSEVTVGKTISVSAIGQRFCVFRGVEGKAYVMDAYCPHLGADLSAGGKVRGECVECPFHGWLFSGEDGSCHNIPYSDKVPDVARAQTWLSCEKNGFVFVWHHAEGNEPSWEMPSVLDVESGRWKFRGRTAHEVHCHIQEIPENGADVAHLHQVHSRSVFVGSSWMESRRSVLDFLQHDWQPVWEQDKHRLHVGRIQLSQRTRFFGFEIPFSTLKMEIEQIGPATVHLHMDTCFGRGVFLQHIIPEGPLNQRIIHLLYTEPRFKQFPANLLVMAEATMLERDIAVWNNKKFLRKPTLVKEDRMINRYRRWYSQFYSEHSPTLRDIRERTLEW